jgi:hypothetical protein
MPRTLATTLLLALAGCTSSQTVYGPDGRQYTRIECNSHALSHGACYRRAMEICPQGYFLTDERTWESQPVSVDASWASSSAQRMSVPGVASQGSARSERQRIAYSGSEIYRHIVIACK